MSILKTLMGQGGQSANVEPFQPRANLPRSSTQEAVEYIADSLPGAYQPLDTELTAIAALVSAADKVPYFTGSGTAALADFSAFARTLVDDADAGTALTTLGVSTFIKTLLDDTDAATARTTLGLVIGTNVQAYDAELAALAGLVSAADSAPYFTGSGTAALMTVTAAARTVLDDATVGAMLTTLGGQPLDAELTAVAGLTSAADRLPYFTGSGTAALATFTTFARTLVDDADASTARTTLGVRDVLSAARTYYVRTDGSNSNTGLANTAGGAFLTIQKAIDTALTLDLSGYALTIQVAAGTYTGTISVTSPFVGGLVSLVGDTTTPSNVVLSHSAYGAFTVGGGATLGVGGFKIANSAASSLGNGMLVNNAASVTLTQMEWGACTRAHIEIASRGRVSVGANFTISGNSPYHWLVSNGDLVLSGIAATLTGTPAFATSFVDASSVSCVTAFSFTFSGSGTGKRYNATLNAVINTFGGGASYFPGNSAGATATGGQYA